MALWLCKSEPDCYSYADLERDQQTLWDGVTNALAQKHLRAMQKGDRVLFYHTGDEKAVVGVMEVTAAPQPAEGNNSGKLVAVPVKAVHQLQVPVRLAAIKGEEMFQEWELVRNSRLSVMPVSEECWRRVEEMSEAG